MSGSAQRSEEAEKIIWMGWKGSKSRMSRTALWKKESAQAFSNSSDTFYKGKENNAKSQNDDVAK